MQIKGRPTFEEHPIAWDDEKVSRLWDYYARTGSDDIYFAKQFGRRILQEAKLPLHERLKVLDFGCGPGFVWEHIIGLGAKWEYTGLDFSEGSVQKVRRRAEGHDQFAEALRVTTLPTSLPEAGFDVVLLLEVIEHLDDAYLDSTLQEVYRTLKPGGIVVVSAPNDEDLSVCTKFCPECGAVFHEWQHVRTWTIGKLAKTLEQYRLQMRAGRVLDFAATGLKGRLIRLARSFLLGKNTAPHMIVLFEKR